MFSGILKTILFNMDVSDEPWKFDFLETNFFTQLPTCQYTFFDIKTPNFAKIRCFLQ